MPHPLPSRVFSSETLVAGVSMMESGLGVSQPEDTFKIMAELKELEVPMIVSPRSNCFFNVDSLFTRHDHIKYGCALHRT